MEGLAKLPGVGGPGVIFCKEFQPICCIGRVNGGNRCQDGNADRIGDLVAVPQAPVAAADREGDDDSNQCP